MATRTGVAGVFRAAIRDEVQMKERALGRGAAQAWDEYLAKVAEIRAFETALGIFERVLEQYLTEDEHDEL